MNKFFIFSLLLVLTFNVGATDISSSYKKIYSEQENPLTPVDLELLKQFEIIFINGVASEFFLQEFIPNFSWATTEYFSASLNELERLGLNPKRVAPSSFNLEEARADIASIFKSKMPQRKPRLILTHSLGGLLLLEHLVANPEHQKFTAGIIFIQGPFLGSPIAELVRSVPLQMANYLSVSTRKKYMEEHKQEISDLFLRLPAITVASIANGFQSIFAPTINLMKYGCVARLGGKCITPRLYRGPYTDSDGMVPVKSSRVANTDHINLRAVDHGETVMNLPFQSVRKSQMTTALLKLLIERVRN